MFGQFLALKEKTVCRTFSSVGWEDDFTSSTFGSVANLLRKKNNEMVDVCLASSLLNDGEFANTLESLEGGAKLVSLGLSAFLSSSSKTSRTLMNVLKNSPNLQHLDVMVEPAGDEACAKDIAAGLSEHRSVTDLTVLARFSPGSLKTLTAACPVKSLWLGSILVSEGKENDDVLLEELSEAIFSLKDSLESLTLTFFAGLTASSASLFRKLGESIGACTKLKKFHFFGGLNTKADVQGLFLNRTDASEEEMRQCLMTCASLEDVVICTRYHAFHMFDKGAHLPNLQKIVVLFGKSAKQRHLVNVFNLPGEEKENMRSVYLHAEDCYEDRCFSPQLMKQIDAFPNLTR